MDVQDAERRLDEVEALTLAGFLLRAYALLNELSAEQATADSTRFRLLRAWVTEHLGGTYRACREQAALFRQRPQQAQVSYFYAYRLLRDRGSRVALRHLLQHPPLPGTSELVSAEHAVLCARLYAYLGDHLQADSLMSTVEPAILGTARWVSARATLLECRDEREAALRLIESALPEEPCHRLLVQACASLLSALNRKEEALELLEAKEPLLEAPLLTAQRARLEHELDSFEAERRSLDRFEQLSICLDAAGRQSLRAQRSENAYRRGDMAEALRFSEGLSGEYWSRFRACLEAHQGPPVRRELATPVLIQDPMGCAPTSLAIISAYFGYPVDHVDVGDQICYEGTASHSERAWVEGRGWLSREFTVDYETSRLLIDRNIPFLLVTVAIASAHAQVVIGYDDTRRTLIIRDPMTSSTLEAEADPLFERHKPYGPRGHVMLPKERSGDLAGVHLPEAHLHDAAHLLRVALEANDRSEALRHHSYLKEQASEHPLVLWGLRSIAAFDGDPYAMQQCSEQLLERFPEEANAEVAILDCLGTIGSHAEQRARLEHHLSKRKPLWIFYERLAGLLSSDASEFERAERLLERALRIVPGRARTIALRAYLYEEQGDLARALFERRVACTLDPTDDRLAWEYFETAYRAGQASRAIELLRFRVRRYQARSCGPSQTLFRALEWADRTEEAFEVLMASIEARPEDPNALCFAAEAQARYGRVELAEELVTRASARSSSITVAQSAALVAEYSSRLTHALERHARVLESFPFALSSQSSLTSLLSDLQGPEKAREHLALMCARYPTHCGLRELYCTWLRGHDPALVLPELSRLLDQQPLHRWAHRERALVLSDLGQHTVAIEAAEHAQRLGPRDVSSHSVLCAVLLAAGLRERAQEAARAAVRLQPDAAGVVSEVLRLANSLEHQRSLLTELEELVCAQSVDGNGVLQWYDFASGLISDEALLARASALEQEKPHWWVGVHLNARFLTRLGRIEQAKDVLTAGLGRFPHVPRLLLDLADVCRGLGDPRGECSAAERAVQLNPRWTQAVLRYAEALGAQGNSEAQRKVLVRGLTHTPRSPHLTQALAKLAWAAGDADVAFATVRTAIAFAPEEEEAWSLYMGFARTLGRTDEVVQYAEALAGERPWNVWILLRLAEVLRSQSENLASLAVLERALERRPGFAQALDVYILTLVRVGRKNEALAACETPVHGHFSRGLMRTRKAWIRWEYGEREAAAKELAEVLSEHPDQAWGHEVLVEWQMELEQHADAIRTAEALVKLSPLTATGHGYLGSAHWLAKDLDAAWDALARASALDPTYFHAASLRLTIALHRGRFADAEALLAEHRPHLEASERDLLDLRLALALKDEARAVALLRDLARRETTSPWHLAGAAQALSELSTPTPSLADRLYLLAHEPGLTADVGAYWLRAALALRQRCVSRIASLHRSNADAATAAAVAYFEAAGDQRFGTLKVLLALLALSDIARSNDAVWGKVGYALAISGSYTLLYWWLSDYAKRTHVEPWMLHNYRVACVHRWRKKAAQKVVEHALSLPADDTLHRHLAFLAFARAAEGDIEGARALTLVVTPKQLGPADAALFQTATALVKLHDAPIAKRPEALTEVAASSGSLWLCFHFWGDAGFIARWAAAGVLRHFFSPAFFLRRWGYLILVLLWFLWIALRVRPFR